MPDNGNSNRITREYLDSLMIETRYMDSETPDLTFRLFGETFPSPIMTAALSHLDHFMFPGAAQALAEGARDAGAVLWYGMAPEEEINRLADTGARMIEIIKPYTDREVIARKIAHAEQRGLLAVGIDIDHAFGDDGGKDVVSGEEMTPLRTAELEEICGRTKLPVIIKGVLSMKDAQKCIGAGAAGLVLSHHNNRIGYAIPPAVILPEIAALAGRAIPVFADCEIQTGMDAFKALALGASVVSVGKALMGPLEENGAQGLADMIRSMTGELKAMMVRTGSATVSGIDPAVIHPISW